MSDDNLFGDEHVKKYQETDGEVGFLWRDNTILLLTTTGRKSGEQHTSALIYRDWDDKQTVVASKGGAPKPPAWFLNLEADPEVTVQIKGDVFAARARTATDEEKPALWKQMTENWPDYDKYQRNTDRVIPVVVLERV